MLYRCPARGPLGHFTPSEWLSVHPAIDVDLVALVLRDVEGVSVRIEAAVLGHGAAARSLTDATLRQRIQEMLDVGHQPTKVVEAVPRTFPLIHVAVHAIRQDGHGGLAVRGPAHDPILRADLFTGGRFAEAKDIDVEIEHLIVIRDAHCEVADARKRALDSWGVKLMRRKAHGLAAGIRHAVVAVE